MCKHFYIEGQRIASKVGAGLSPSITPFQNNEETTPIYNNYDSLPEALLNMCKRSDLCVDFDTKNTQYGRKFSCIHDLSDQDSFEKDLYFYHSDHIGSSSFITDADGYASQHLQYLPFGEPNRPLAVSSRIPLNYNTFYEQLFVEQRSTANYYTPYKFSGKEKDEETSYSYFGARYYMSDISVWLSVDPLKENYPYQSPYTYCGWNPIKIVDPVGMDEFEIDNETGKVSKVNQNKHYVDANGNKIIVKEGEEYKGNADLSKMKPVDQVSNSKGEKKDFSAGVLGGKQSDEKSFQFFAFGNPSEAEDFYYFAAQSSNAEWAFGETLGAGYVGTDYQPGTNRMEGLFENIFGSNLLRLSHSHSGSGGEPSYNLRDSKNNLCGDVNSAANRQLNAKYEVFDVTNRKIYSYDKNTLYSIGDRTSGYSFDNKPFINK